MVGRNATRSRSANRRAMLDEAKVSSKLMSWMVALFVVFSLIAPATCLNAQLYDCPLNYIKVSKSFIKFSIEHLVLDYNPTQASKEVELEEFQLTDSIEKFLASRLNPNLPFVFFMNGFNHGELL